jgi:hypothetical protein
MNSGVEMIVTNGVFDFTGLSGEFMSSYYPGIADNRMGSVTKGTRSVLTVQDKGIVSGGTFRVSQGNPYPGIVNLNPGGIMALNKFNNDNENCPGAINFNGGSLVRRSGVNGALFSYSGTDSEAKWRKVTVNIMEGGLHFTDGGRDITGRVDHEERPCGHKHEQGDGCLVDFRHTLYGYAEIADTEDDDDCNR